MRARGLLAFVAMTVAAGPAPAQTPLGTAFTYQGRLTDAGNPANGTYDLQLALFGAASGGASIGPVLARDDVAVTTGLFTVSLDFGAVFAGDKRWVELRVRPGASTGAYTTLAPRQELAPAPTASFSAAAPWAGIAGKPAGFADDVDDDSGGDITDVTAGAGLTGGGGSGPVTLGVSFAGNGVTPSAARSDHDHTLQTWAAVQDGPIFRIVNTASFGDGFWGQANATTGNGRGIVGYSSGTVGANYGMWGQAESPAGTGVFGLASATTGINRGVSGRTDSPDGYGVFGLANATTGPASAVRGETRSGAGSAGVVAVVTATSGTSYALFAQNLQPLGFAGHFNGRVQITGTLGKGGGSFKIDHPLDPENKYLYHSFVESPDMMNIYNGNVVTDAAGFATVELPEWFEALNRDFRYQLTVIGRMAQAVVAREVEGHRFTIETSAPDVKVSWQVTGIRKDAFAEKHRIPVEEDKPADERGKYLYPEEHGVPRERGITYGPHSEPAVSRP